MSKFKEGDVVRLKPDLAVPPKFVPEGRQNNRTAKVKCYIGSVYPGGVALDRDLNGCIYWNEDDLLLCHNVADNTQTDAMILALKLAISTIRLSKLPKRLNKPGIMAALKTAIGA